MIKMILRVLINNKKEIVKTIYEKLLKRSGKITQVADTLKIGMGRIGSMLRWIYASIVVTFLSYIVSVFKLITDMFIVWFGWLQSIGHWLIMKLTKITGPLSMQTLDNLWLVFVMLSFLLVIYMIIKMIKFLFVKYLEYRKNKEELKKELVTECEELDNAAALKILNELGLNENKEKLTVIPNTTVDKKTGLVKTSIVVDKIQYEIDLPAVLDKVKRIKK